MEKTDRELIRKNLTRLIETTELNEALQTKLVETGIFNTTMVEEFNVATVGTLQMEAQWYSQNLLDQT